MKHFGSILFLSLVILLLGGAMFVLSLMKRPLGPSLILDVPPAKALASSHIQPAAPVRADKICGNTGQMSILVIGQGLVENGYLLGSGAIRLVVVDFDQPNVSLLSMPGELWVDAKVLNDPDTPFEKLDLIYHRVFLDSGGPEDVAHVKGTQALAQAVVDNFGFVPDHYITVLQQPFIELVDTLGGIDVDLPEEIISGNEDIEDYPAGPQHLDGSRTLDLTRVNPVDGYDAWDRFDHQEIVLQGLLAAIMKPENWDEAPELVKQARKALLTDLSVDQAMDLQCMVEEAGDEVHMLQVEEDMVTIDPEGHWNPDFQAVKDLIEQMVNP